MQEAMSSFLVSLHKTLYPAREAIFITGLLYLIATGFYYQWQRSRDTISPKKIIRNAILHAGFAGIMASYGATLEVQEQYFLDHVLILLPVCTLLALGMLMLFLWLGYYFVSKSKNERESKKS